MPRAAMNAMKKEDINQIGEKTDSPMPPPVKKGERKPVNKPDSPRVGKHDSEWF